MFRLHDKNVFDNSLAHFLCLFQQRVSLFFHVPFQRWDPYLSSDERAWITLISRTSLPVLSEETGSS